MAKNIKTIQRKAEKKRKRAKLAKKERTEQKLKKKQQESSLIEPDDVKETREVDYSKINPYCVDTNYILTTQNDSTGVQQNMHLLCSQMRAYDWGRNTREKIEQYGYYEDDDRLQVKQAAIRGIVADVRFGWDADELREFDPIALIGLDWESQRAEAALYPRSIMLLNPVIYDTNKRKIRPLETSHVWLNIRDIVPNESSLIKIRLYDTLTVKGRIHHYAKQGAETDHANKWSLADWTPTACGQTYSCEGRPRTTPVTIKRLCTILSSKPGQSRLALCRQDEHIRDLERLVAFVHPTAHAKIRPDMLS